MLIVHLQASALAFRITTKSLILSFIMALAGSGQLVMGNLSILRVISAGECSALFSEQVPSMLAPGLAYRAQVGERPIVGVDFTLGYVPCTSDNNECYAENCHSDCEVP